VKAREECCICYCNMNKAKERYKLSCGHYFHKHCLEKCVKSECPICRKAFEERESFDLYEHSIVKTLFLEVFAFSPNVQNALFTSFTKLLDIVYLQDVNDHSSQPRHLHFASEFLTIYEQLDLEQKDICNIATMINMAFDYMAHNKTLNGFSIQCYQDRVNR
jgi:hypothetical protein